MSNFNVAMMNKILTEASALSAEVLAKGRAQSKLEGTALAASGKGVREIKEDMSTFDKIFGGNVTLQAAHEFALDAGVNEYIAGVNDNMGELRKKKPEQFALEQVDAFAGQMTGDAEMDREVLQRSQVAVAAASKAQGKEHAVFVQEQALSDYTNSITQAQKSVQSSRGKDVQAAQEADAALLKALQRPKDMTAEAHKSAVLSLDKLYMQQGDESIHRHLNDLVDQTPEDLLESASNEILRVKAMQSQHTLAIAKAMSDIEEAADRGASDTQLMAMGQAVADKYGVEALGSRMTSILTARAAKGLGKMTQQETIDLYMQPGGALNFASKKDGENAMAWANEALRQTEEPEVAERLILQKWAGHHINDPRVVNWTNHAAQNPLDGGEVNQQYLDLLTDTEPYMVANREKAVDMFKKPEDLQRYLAIRDQIADGVDPIVAVRTFANKDAAAARKAYTSDPRFKEQVVDMYEDIIGGKIDIPFVKDENWSALQNQPEMLAAVKSSMLRAAAQTGHVDNLGEVAMADLRKRHSVVNGAWVRTGTKTMQERLGVDADDKVVMDHFFATTFIQDFPNYNPANARIIVDPASNTFIIKNQLSNGVLDSPHNTNFGRLVYHIEDIGANYNALVKDPAEAQQLADNMDESSESFKQALFNKKRIIRLDLHMTGRTKTEEQIEAEARHAMTVETSLHRITREKAEDFIRGLGVVGEAGAAVGEGISTGVGHVADWLTGAGSTGQFQEAWKPKQ